MLTCPYCQASLSEAEVSMCSCRSCGRTLPSSVQGSTAAPDEEFADAGGRTMQMPDEFPNAWDANSGGQTMMIPDAEGHVEDPSPMGTVAFDEDESAFPPAGGGATMPLDGDSPFGPAGFNEPTFSPPTGGSNIPSDDGGAFRTMAMEDPSSVAEGIMGTFPLDHGVPSDPEQLGAMRTMEMAGDDPLSSDAGMATVRVPDGGVDLGRTLTDISRSALFADDDGTGGAGSAEGAHSPRAGSGALGAGSASGVMGSGSRSGSGSGSTGDTPSGLAGLSDASGQTFISDDWASPGIDQTMQVSEGAGKPVDQVIQTIWMEADPKAQPGMTVRGAERIGPKPLTKPSTGSPLVIKPRMLKRLEEKTAGMQVDYELLKVLGEGGMGVVFDARQMSIDRNVAVKMLKPNTTKDDKQKQKFLAEAVVTGELDHPNIVPIYDVGTNDQGALFYSMKKVQGTPWLKVVTKKTVPENVEILMKVADAVAFAHSRGVVHRDLKPENVMLGDYGEVLVMDWGLAQSTAAFRKRSSITESHGMGGTPAYMAPEMATGPLDKIGPLADVYLLGAILYEIITGRPPHAGKTAMMCLMAAAKNEILATDKSGELVDIARKAMATNQAERYQSVLEFQNAIREFQSHSQSTSLSTAAVDDLAQAGRTNDYQDFSRAVFGFQEALELWSGNTRAKTGLIQAKVAYASSALAKGDYDLGASLLDPKDPQQMELFGRIRSASEERERRQQRLKTMKRLLGGAVAVVFLIITVATVLVEIQRRDAVYQKELAVAAEKTAVAAEKTAVKEKQNALKAKEQEEVAKGKAIEAEKVALEQKKKAEDAKVVAENEKVAAEKARNLAIDAQKAEELAKKEAIAAKEREEYEAYVARIGLASAKIKENAFDTATKLLLDCEPKDGKKDFRNWEWGRLMHLCTLSESTLDLEVPVDSLAVSRDGQRFAAGTRDTRARIFDIETQKLVAEIKTKGQYVHAVAFSPNGQYLVTGGSAAGGKYDTGDNLTLWDIAAGKSIRTFPGHTDAVTSVSFSKDGTKLLSSSFDRTARLWDVASGKPLKTFEGHLWYVWSAAFAPDELHIVTAGGDGTVRVWTLDGKSGSPFSGHKGPVYSAAFSPDGRKVVSGGADKRVLVWQPDEVKFFDFENLVGNLESEQPTPVAATPFVELVGHNAAVRSVSFSSDGGLVLSSSGDNTIRLWDLPTRTTVRTFRGHNELVQTVTFLPDGRGMLSASHDHKVKLWSISGKEEFRVLAGKLLQGHQDEVLAASFSKDGTSIVTASRDRTARTWDLKTGELSHILQEGHEFLASSVKFFDKGRKLVTSAVDGTTRVWDVAEGTELFRLAGTGQSAVVAVSPDDKWIATGSPRLSDKAAGWNIQLWSAATGDKQILELAGHRGEITALAFSADSLSLLSGDAVGESILWNLSDGQIRQRITGHLKKISAVAFLSQGRALTASADGTVGQWNTLTGAEEKKLILKHPGDVLALDVSADGKLVATTSLDGRIRLWNPETAQLISSIFVPGDAPSAGQKAARLDAVGLSADKRRVLAVDAKSRSVHLFDVATNQEIPGAKGTKVFLQSANPIWSAAFAPLSNDSDAAYLVTVGGNEARIWTKTGRSLVNFAPHATVASAGFSPDGKWIVTGSWDQTARIWDVKSGKDVRKLAEYTDKEGRLHRGHTGNINSAIFSPGDGKFVLTASDDQTAILWDRDTAEIVRIFGRQIDGKGQRTGDGHDAAVVQAVFSDDGTKILTASRDKTARIWDVATGKSLAVLKGHGYAVRCVAISKDGTRIITGSEDLSARLWDVKADAQGNLTVEQRKLELKGHTAAVVSVALSQDGKRALTGSGDNNAKLWDAESSKEILTLDGHQQEVTAVSFSPDGQFVLTGSRDGTARVWLSVEWKHPADVARQKERTAR